MFDVLVTIIIDAILPNCYNELIVKSDFAAITKSPPIIDIYNVNFCLAYNKICFIFHGVLKQHLHLYNVVIIQTSMVGYWAMISLMESANAILQTF